MKSLDEDKKGWPRCEDEHTRDGHLCVVHVREVALGTNTLNTGWVAPRCRGARLMMLMTGEHSIREVVLFPALRDRDARAADGAATEGETPSDRPSSLDVP